MPVGLCTCAFRCSSPKRHPDALHACFQGGIYCLNIAASLLVSGGADASLRVWSFNALSGTFMVQVRGRSCPFAATCIVLTTEDDATALFFVQGGLSGWFDAAF